jgi:hypothetical protein
MSLAVRRIGPRDGAESDARPMTPKEAADYLRISVRALHRLPIPCHLLSQRRRLYTKRILDDFLEETLCDPGKKRATP